MSSYEKMFTDYTDEKEKVKTLSQKQVNHIMKCFTIICPDLPLILENLDHVTQTNFNTIKNLRLGGEIKDEHANFLFSLLSELYNRRVFAETGYDDDGIIKTRCLSMEKDLSKTKWKDFLERLAGKDHTCPEKYFFPRKDDLNNHERKTFETLNGSDVVYFWKDNNTLAISNMNTKENAIFRINKLHPHFEAISKSLDNI